MTAEAAYTASAEGGALFKGLSKIHGALNRVGRFSWWLDAVGLVIFFMMMCLTFCRRFQSPGRWQLAAVSGSGQLGQSLWNQRPVRRQLF